MSRLVGTCQESDCGFGLASESYTLFQGDHRMTMLHKELALLLLYVLVIFTTSLPDALFCLLMSLPCCKGKIHGDPLTTVDSAQCCHPENRWDSAGLCGCPSRQAQSRSIYLSRHPPEQLLGALTGVSADKDDGEAADLGWSLSLGLL